MIRIINLDLVMVVMMMMMTMVMVMMMMMVMVMKRRRRSKKLERGEGGLTKTWLPTCRTWPGRPCSRGRQSYSVEAHLQFVQQFGH